MAILENASYIYRGWMIAIDRWSRMRHPNFLRHIPFWVKIDKLPEVFRRISIVESIGSMMGHVDEVRIVEPVLQLDRPAEVWVKVDMDIDS
ncbi:unnamed protein product [Arabis nemorensis]|uniref:Uncharacterized protein n=1 Tax=Arabis nemorensis TaxID=586526 RepID=A0A565BAB4_9BRAS|nr:unnamed protein product [Arabis nemorensis]